MKVYLFYIKDQTWRRGGEETYLLVYGDSIEQAARKVRDVIKGKSTSNNPDDWLIKNCTIE